MTPLFKDIDVLEPTGSRRHGQYKEAALAEAGEFYSLKEHVMDRLNLSLAAIKNEKEKHYGVPSEWKGIEKRLEALIQDVALFKEGC
jgi:hypothetical protein